MSKEREAEIVRRIDESFYQQYLQNEKDFLEGCEWFHKGENCDCKEIVKEMQEQREKWWQETLKEREQASEETASEVEEIPEKGPSDEAVNEVKETPKEGTGPSEEAVGDEW